MFLLKFLAFWLGLILPFVANAELNVAVGVAEIKTGQPAQTGGLASFNEDIGRKLCRRLRQPCVVSNVLFGEMIPGLENGRFDLGFGNFLRTPEREKRIGFSDTIWRSSSRLVGTPAAASRFESQSGSAVSLDKLRNLRVVVVGESQQHKFLVGLAESRAVEVVVAKSMSDTMVVLRDNKADFALLPMLSAFALLAQEENKGFQFFGSAVATQGLGGDVHIGLDRNKPELLKNVNAALADMRSDGTFHRIVRRYFPFNLD